MSRQEFLWALYYVILRTELIVAQGKLAARKIRHFLGKGDV
jgi:hypothetical protein